MGEKTKISWSEYTWNVVTGCTKVSEGCKFCYIDRTMPFRIAGRKFDSPDIGGHIPLLFHPERFEKIIRKTKPQLVFVNSLSDLFHNDVPDEYIARTFAAMAVAQQHTFQLLTKRPARMRSLLSREVFRHQVALAMIDFTVLAKDHEPRQDKKRPVVPWPLPNLWLGVTVEDQKAADLRIPILLRTPAAVRWLSCEPLIGPVSLHRYLPTHPSGAGNYPAKFITDQFPAEFAQWKRERGVDWVVVGGESGLPGEAIRPMRLEWATTIVEQCAAAGVPSHFKQLGHLLADELGIPGKGADPALWPEPWPQEYPETRSMGKGSGADA